MPMAHFVAVLSAAYKAPDSGTPIIGNYWRIRMRAGPTSGNIQFSEAFFYKAGVDICTGGTVIKSAELNNTTWAAINAFDRNNLTDWSSGEPNGGLASWIGYQFPSAVIPDKIGFTASNSFPIQNGQLFAVEWSEDGITWHLYALVDDSVAGPMAIHEHREWALTKQKFDVWDTNPHRYWRLLFVMNGSDAFNTVTEIDLFDAAGVNLTDAHAFTPTASSQQGPYPASNAFDNNTATQWYTNGVVGQVYMDIDWGSGNAYAVSLVKLTASAGDPTRTPSSFILQYSDNGTTWVNRGLSMEEVFAASEVKEYNFAPADPALMFNYFRVRYGKTQSGSGVFSMEVEFRFGGIDQTAGGAAVFSSQASPTTYKADNAFDNNVATQYGTNPNMGEWLGYKFPTPKQITEVKWGAGLSGDAGKNPRHLLFETSTDGATWTLQQDVFSTGSMTAGTYRTYPVVKINYHQNDDAAHRYWRIRPFMFGNGCTAAEIREIYFLTEAEVDLTTGGTPMGSTAAAGNPLANAFDKGSGVWKSFAIDQDMWIGYDFLTPVTPKKVRIQAGGAAANHPYAFAVEFSDNATDWFPVNAFVDIPWINAETRTFILSRLTPILFVSKASRYVISKRTGVITTKVSRYIIFKP